MVRAAAKNHPSVAVVVDPARYGDVLEAVGAGGFTLEQRKRLAAEAFVHTAAYDIAVASWFGLVLRAGRRGPVPGRSSARTWQRESVLRYGENPHQGAALYVGDEQERGTASRPPSSCTARRCPTTTTSTPTRRAARPTTSRSLRRDHQARQSVRHRGERGRDIAEAHRQANECDPVSAYGGMIASNRIVTEAMARQVADVFTEVICAPDFEPTALDVLTAKKNIRILKAGTNNRRAVEFRQICGGVLLQTGDRYRAPATTRRTGRCRPASGRPATLADLEFAWRASRSVKSNAILLAGDGATVGVGMGQVNRVDSAQLAVSRGGRPGHGLGARLRRVLPVRRRTAGADRRRRAGGGRARRLDARRRSDRGRPRRPA